jgi:hypothetical protein
MEMLWFRSVLVTGLKPGVNERFCESYRPRNLLLFNDS